MKKNIHAFLKLIPLISDPKVKGLYFTIPFISVFYLSPIQAEETAQAPHAPSPTSQEVSPRREKRDALHHRELELALTQANTLTVLTKPSNKEVTLSAEQKKQLKSAVRIIDQADHHLVTCGNKKNTDTASQALHALLDSSLTILQNGLEQKKIPAARLSALQFLVASLLEKRNHVYSSSAGAEPADARPLRHAYNLISHILEINHDKVDNLSAQQKVEWAIQVLSPPGKSEAKPFTSVGNNTAKDLGEAKPSNHGTDLSAGKGNQPIQNDVQKNALVKPEPLSEGKSASSPDSTTLAEPKPETLQNILERPQKEEAQQQALNQKVIENYYRALKAMGKETMCLLESKAQPQSETSNRNSSLLDSNTFSKPDRQQPDTSDEDNYRPRQTGPLFPEEKPTASPNNGIRRNRNPLTPPGDSTPPANGTADSNIRKQDIGKLSEAIAKALGNNANPAQDRTYASMAEQFRKLLQDWQQLQAQDKKGEQQKADDKTKQAADAIAKLLKQQQPDQQNGANQGQGRGQNQPVAERSQTPAGGQGQQPNFQPPYPPMDPSQMGGQQPQQTNPYAGMPPASSPAPAPIYIDSPNSYGSNSTPALPSSWALPSVNNSANQMLLSNLRKDALTTQLIQALRAKALSPAPVANVGNAFGWPGRPMPYYGRSGVPYAGTTPYFGPTYGRSSNILPGFRGTATSGTQQSLGLTPYPMSTVPSFFLK